MNTSEIAPTLVTLLRELLEGAPKAGGYVLNGGDQGLLRSLDKLSASAASSASTGGASIAAHVDHLRFGLSLLNRWGEGDEDSFKGADWAASWRKTRVSDQDGINCALTSTGKPPSGWQRSARPGKPRSRPSQGWPAVLRISPITWARFDRSIEARAALSRPSGA